MEANHYNPRLETFDGYDVNARIASVKNGYGFTDTTDILKDENIVKMKDAYGPGVGNVEQIVASNSTAYVVTQFLDMHNEVSKKIIDEYNANLTAIRSEELLSYSTELGSRETEVENYLMYDYASSELPSLSSHYADSDNNVTAYLQHVKDVLDYWKDGTINEGFSPSLSQDNLTTLLNRINTADDTTEGNVGDFIEAYETNRTTVIGEFSGNVDGLPAGTSLFAGFNKVFEGTGSVLGYTGEDASGYTNTDSQIMDGTDTTVVSIYNKLAVRLDKKIVPKLVRIHNDLYHGDAVYTPADISAVPNDASISGVEHDSSFWTHDEQA